MFEITLERSASGDPFIVIQHGEIGADGIYMTVSKNGVGLADYDNSVFTPTELMGTLMECLREAQRMLADPPPHLLSGCIAPPPDPGPPCHCLAEIRWETSDGGHWMHVDDSITDHEAAPKEQPVVDQTRTVIGSIDDLTMTENGNWIPKL